MLGTEALLQAAYHDHVVLQKRMPTLRAVPHPQTGLTQAMAADQR